MSHPASVYVPSHASDVTNPLLPGSASILAACVDVLAILLAGMFVPSLYWLFTEIAFRHNAPDEVVILVSGDDQRTRPKPQRRLQGQLG